MRSPMGDIIQLPARPPAPRISFLLRVYWGVERRLLTLERFALWLLRPKAFPRPLRVPLGAFPSLCYQRVHPLDPTARRAGAEAAREDLARAAGALDGVLLSADRPLSLWRTLGRRDVDARGAGEEVRLIAGALAAMAATLGWRVLERHQADPTPLAPGAGESAPPPPEALVAWPALDLRIAPRDGRVRLEVEVRGGALHLRVRGEAAAMSRPAREAAGARRAGAAGPGPRRDGVLLRLAPRSTPR
jgi:vancomycin resistance protein VanW